MGRSVELGNEEAREGWYCPRYEYGCLVRFSIVHKQRAVPNSLTVRPLPHSSRLQNLSTFPRSRILPVSPIYLSDMISI